MAKNYHLYLKGYVGDYNFDPDYVDYILDKHQGETVNVLIDSLGGDTASAFTISGLFRNHGDVHVHYVGMNASAATITSMGAKHVTIDENALYLVHKCSAFVLRWDFLNADQLQQLIDEATAQKRDLDKIDLTIANAYAKRCKKEPQELLNLMAEGGWLTAKEALEWGFVDEITDAGEQQPELTPAVAAYCDQHSIPLPPLEQMQPSRWNNFLEWLRNRFNDSKPQTDNTMNDIVCNNICSILNREALQENQEQQITLHTDDVQALEEAIQDLHNQIDALNAQLSERDATIDELRNQPADTSSQVVDTKPVNDEAEDDFFAVRDRARELFNSLD